MIGWLCGEGPGPSEADQGTLTRGRCSLQSVWQDLRTVSESERCPEANSQDGADLCPGGRGQVEGPKEGRSQTQPWPGCRTHATALLRHESAPITAVSFIKKV